MRRLIAALAKFIPCLSFKTTRSAYKLNNFVSVCIFLCVTLYVSYTLCVRYMCIYARTVCVCALIYAQFNVCVCDWTFVFHLK